MRACVQKIDITDAEVEQGKDWKVVLVGTGEMKNGSEWVRKVMLVEREESAESPAGLGSPAKRHSICRVMAGQPLTAILPCQ